MAYLVMPWQRKRWVLSWVIILRNLSLWPLLPATWKSAKSVLILFQALWTGFLSARLRGVIGVLANERRPGVRSMPARDAIVGCSNISRSVRLALRSWLARAK